MLILMVLRFGAGLFAEGAGEFEVVLLELVDVPVVWLDPTVMFIVVPEDWLDPLFVFVDPEFGFGVC